VAAGAVFGNGGVGVAERLGEGEEVRAGLATQADEACQNGGRAFLDRLRALDAAFIRQAEGGFPALQRLEGPPARAGDRRSRGLGWWLDDLSPWLTMR